MTYTEFERSVIRKEVGRRIEVHNSMFDDD